MGKEMTTQVQEAQNGPYRVDPSRNTARHILIKLTKIKDKNIKGNKRKKINK